MTVITSRENEKIKQLCKLVQSTAYRCETRLFVVEGIKLCRDIAQITPAKEVYYTETAAEKYPEIAKLCNTQFVISESVSQKISDVKTPQGVYCVFEIKNTELSKITLQTRLLVLDNVQDPANVGAALRSAVAFGFEGVLVSSQTADVYSPKAVRSAMSSTVKLPVLRCESLAETLQQLKQQGVTLLAARLENSVSMQAVNPTGAIAVVIGNEGQGVTQEVANVCDYSIRIPISTEMESLNATVAAGIVMYNYKK